jgi:hypothetical protein
MSEAPAGFVGAGSSPAARYGLHATAWAQLDEKFESLALALFAYQYERIQVYRDYARLRGCSPASVQRACDVPALPVEAFKRGRVAAFAPEFERARFETSGTTGALPGTLHLDRLDLYERALERGFRHHVVPDVDHIRMLFLAPSPAEAPNSSLTHMFERVRARWGAPGSASFLRAGRLDWPGLRRALEAAGESREPVCVLGTAFAWVQALDACTESSFHVELPEGSRVFETGGFKGRSREISRAELLQGIERRLGVPMSYVVGEYGMTEMASQLYTLSLRRSLLGEQPLAQEIWSHPAWLRPRLLNSDSGQPQEIDLARGVGLLAHHDLANRGAPAHLLTADLGRPRAGSFELLGRCPEAEPRGCGLPHEVLRTSRTASESED